ncbi:hypothetical protein DWW14_20960 [Bacteroides uniformis]|uniref:Phage MuF C-terminal domain-containing protein n=1 Tax=Bacteroides uniformis TaxID=820 RepID=A0A412X674_BACUN|nr:hypothetical protein [Bacteroides uniformis]RGV36504.1 hypothetical protein DWW14_20960 [Bacteroides uniformis]
MDAARKQELDNIFNNALKASTNYSIQNAYYGTDSGVDPLSTLGFIDKQTGYDVESKITTALLNGAKSGIKGLLANAGAMVEENIAIHKRQDPNYIPYGGYAPKIAEQFNSLANSEILQRTDVRSSSKLGQFGLDFLEGAGQFVPQIAVTGLTGGIGGGIFMGMSIAGNQYSDLRAQGVDVETAAKASRYNAIIQAPLEQLALGKVLASLPAGSPLKKRLVRLLESAITEGGTEFIQEFPEQLTNIYAQNPNADAKQIATEWDKNWQENIKNAGYSGLIGALLGVGASGAKIAIDSIGENVDAEIHKEKLTQLENNIENVKKSGVNPEYAAGVINTNRPSDFISIDGQKLQQYMQEQGAEKITQALNITEDEVNAAATDGLDVEVPIGDFTAAACKYGDFYKTMQDHISFGDGDYSVNDRKLKKDLRKAYQISENAREELDIEVDKIVENSTNAKMNQEERGALREFLVSQAMIVNPENPAQYFRDHPVEIKRVVSTPKGRYMQTKSANEKLIEDERNFAGIVDEYTAGKINDTKTYNVMTTPLALGLAGGKILPVTIDGSKIKHIFDGHSDGMTPELLKQVPRAMADPMMVLDSYAGRKVVVLDLKDAQGSTIIIPLELDVERNRYQVNAVGSAYGKGGENGTDYDWFIEHNLKKGRVSYINKEKTAKWLQSPGSDSASRGNDLDSLLNNSIPDENALRKRREEMQGYYQAEGKTKGAITWDEEGKAIISLFEGSDVTTVFHETGHYFVENLANDVNSGKATEQRQKDWETLLDYAGITNEQWLNMSIDERRPAHEKWAEGFETYVMEGKAPSLALRHVFAKMAKWMKRVYESIRRNENAAPLTDEVRQVFDRMLASEEEINTMSRVDGYFNKLPSVITDNLSESSKIRLENYIAKARDEAVDILTRESLRNFTKERRVAIEDFKDKLRPEIRTEVEKQPLYAAGRMLVDDLQKKQTAKGVADYYLGLIARTLDIESKPLSEVEELDVMKFDMIAEAQGFSGDELAKRLIAEPTLEQAIERALDNAVQVKFPDIYKERQLAEDAAREAIYNDDSGLLIGVEQQLIEDMAANINNKQRSTEQALALARARKQQAKLAAKAEISKMSMSNALKTGRFVMAERRAAAQAAKAIKAKSFEEAADYKRQQAFNHALVLESLKMKQEKSRAEKFLKRQFKAKKETWEDEKHFTQAAAIMERMGLKRKDYDPALRKQSLIEYAEEMQEQYDNVAIADWLMDEGTSLDNPAAMTFEQHQDVINALKNIKAIVKQEKYVTWYGKELNYKEFKDEAIRNLLKLKTKWQSGINSKEKAKPSQRFFRNLTNTDNFFERMDGWKYGFFSKHFGESGQIAANKKAAYTMEFEERIADATKKWLPDKKAAEAADKEIYYEPFKASLTKHNIIKMLLYLGSESSSYKLCSVGPNSTYATFFRGSELWVEGDLEQTRSNLLEALGNVLTEADIRYAEEISAACSAHWNELSDMVKRTTGFSPERVDAMPAELTLRNGAKVVFRGGYIPLVRYTDGGSHPATSDAVPATSDKRAVNSIRTLHTNTGGTKARDRSVYPLDLRKGAEYSAVMDNIHDLCYRELATSYRKMLNDPEMYSLLKEKLGIANFEAFTEYLKKTAQPYDGGYASISERDAGTCLSWIRQKAVNVAIMLNFKTAVQNLGNPLLYGNVVEGFGYKDVMAAYGNLFLNMQKGQGWKASKELVYSKSSYMKERSVLPDISLRDMKDESRKLNPVEQVTVEFGTKALVFTDNLSAIPVWIQAYQKKINVGVSEQEAVLFADTVIRRTLGSSRITDVAPIQRGSALMKLFTTFQGFFNTQFNQWQREAGIFGREWSAGRKVEASKRIVAFAAAKYFMFCLLNLAFALEPPFEEDDDEWTKYGKELLQYPMSLLGPVGQVANTLVSNMVGMRTYGYRMTAVQGSIEQAERTVKKISSVQKGNAEPEELIEPLANLGGLIAGVPAQFNKLFFNAYDIVVNDMEPQWGDIYRRRPKKER